MTNGPQFIGSIGSRAGASAPKPHRHSPVSPPIGFAHRGGRGGFPENTLRTFSAALGGGARALESDLWATSDDIPVLDHDGLVNESMPLRTVARADLPAHVPALADLYEQCGVDYELSLDVLDRRALGPALVVARKAHAVDRLWLVGSWPEVVSWRVLDPSFHIVAGLTWRHLGRGLGGLLRTAVENGVCAINMPYWQWNPLLVRRVHAAGLLAFGWRANRRGEVMWLRRCGCDGIYSDSLAELRGLAATKS
jgi:glycerophosphoryl diester phosphodiesterase